MALHKSLPVRVRFAPSPTGYLHIGSFRTALFNWLFAQHHNGTFLVRIEDTDIERSKPEYVQSIMHALEWVDLYPDEPIVTQSDRMHIYHDVLQRLLDEEKAYKCFCTPQDIAARARESTFILYDGYCRTADQNTQKPFVIRFKLPDIREVSFHDLIRGEITFPIEQLDDFIIARSDGHPIYNFVVMVDDHAMHITHVIRGEDHISNTPKQILLYHACGYESPYFAHIPLILGPSGDRLSKRDGATSALAYKQLGYLPDALLNYLVRLGWSHGDQEIFTREQLITFFTLSDVGKKAAIFDIDKLNWMNGVYMRQWSAHDLLAYIMKALDSDFANTLSQWNTKQIEAAIDLFKSRVDTVIGLMQSVRQLYTGPQIYDPESLEKWVDTSTKSYIDALITLLKSEDKVDELQTKMKALAQSLGIKFVVLAQPIRIACIGSSNGPGVFDMIAVVGTQQVATRLSQLRDTVG